MAAVPYLDGAREAIRDGYISGGSRRNLDWIAPHWDFGDLPENERLLLADAQTSGGLLVAGELSGFPVIGELVPRGERLLIAKYRGDRLSSRHRTEDLTVIHVAVSGAGREDIMKRSRCRPPLRQS